MMFVLKPDDRLFQVKIRYFVQRLCFCKGDTEGFGRGVDDNVGLSNEIKCLGE